MRYEMVVGLEVDDQEAYTRERAEMGPLRAMTDGAFRYDFAVSSMIHGEVGAAINRAFVIQFPNRSTKERFFADPRYLEIRRRLFEPAVKARVTSAEYVTDACAR